MQRYLETRPNTSLASSVGADLARHLLPRQHLGKTVVVCDKPVITISVVRKYWLKLSRNLQRERASTLNAEKILQLTYDITHMQHMDFAAKPFHDNPQADVFFVTPDELAQLPSGCFSMYLLIAPPLAQLQNAIQQLPDRALVVDYTHDPSLTAVPLRPKKELEQLLPAAWRNVDEFFSAQHIDISHLADSIQRGDRIDEALDVILNTSSQFMRIADDFLELLRLCQPAHITNSEQQLYDMIAVLNRKIYALTPGTLSQQFAQTLGGDDLSLHDIATESWAFALAV